MSGSVSVVVPTWNRAHLLARALDSVIAQLEPGDEVIVADDGSTDRTAALLAGYGPPVRHLRLVHAGAGAARNAAWRVARGPLVAFLDSDDRWLPGKLALQRALLGSRPDLVACFSDFRTATIEGSERAGGLAGWIGAPPAGFACEVAAARFLGELLPGGPWDPATRVTIGDFALAALRATIVNIGTLLVRKDRVGEELGCAEDLPTYEELPAVARILGAGPAAFLEAETLVQHDHRGPRLTGADLIVRARARIAVLERAYLTDRAFVERYGDELAARLRAERIGLVRLLLAAGASAEARALLARIAEPPAGLALVASLPGSSVARIVRARDHARGLARKAAAILPWLPPLW
ncbi:MAG: glycosyltransferase family 2 protein [Geminicoccaceae bacterium]|nr:glycosyltransferase family 2 protein [Geminicoccaceae bacterium]